jgi:nucleobase:cation symporter-1, NCS1 family
MTIAGFIRRVRGVSNGNGWDGIYDLSHFLGFFVSGTIHWLLHTAFPAPKQTGASAFLMELHRTRPVDGNYVGSHSSHDKAVVLGREQV